MDDPDGAPPGGLRSKKRWGNSVKHDSSGRIYLITGGASLIGSHLADALLAGGASEVRLLDNYSLGTPETIAHLDGEPRVKRVRGDILTEEAGSMQFSIMPRSGEQKEEDREKLRYILPAYFS